MSKFNKETNIRKKLEEHPDAALNYEGGLSFKLDPRTELYIKVASCLVSEPKFYESAHEADESLLMSINKVIEIDPEFVLQLAVFAREELHLRSVPLVLLIEYANSTAVQDNLNVVKNARKYVTRCIQRADELTEIISLQLQRNKMYPRKRGKLPMMIKYGVRNAWSKFDEYQLGKYDRDKEVKLKDVLFMTHPIPKDHEQQVVFDKLVDGYLEMPITWETMRSTGQMGWHDVINNVFNKDGKIMNYMAQLRNLRNCLEADDITNKDILLLCRMLSDGNAVRRSKQLPFRFFSAYNVIENIDHPMINSVKDALETAFITSAENIPHMDGLTLIACDVSASMEQPISARSSVERFDIGIILGMLAHKFCDQSITGFFGDIWKVVPLSKYSGGLHNAMEMHNREGEVGYSTNGYAVIDYLLEKDVEVDRILIFTDCQMWDSYGDCSFAETFTKYQRKYPNVKLYLFDLSGYGDIVVPQDTKNACFIGGWSDGVLRFIKLFEEGGRIAIDKIKEIKP